MTLHWIHTSDVHGHLDALQGIGKHVNELRNKYGSANVILTDGGDVLQGHPCVYYHNFIDTQSSHIVAETMNRMGYDCMAVGNHDIEAGHKVYDRVFPQFNFPALCANVTKTSIEDDGTSETIETIGTIETIVPPLCDSYFKPYYIIEKGGFRIAVLSLLTPDTAHWLSPSQYEGMTFNDPIESARYWIAHIKQNVQYDLLVGLFHIGWPELSSLCETDDSFEILQSFNLILYGHDHHQGVHKVGQTLCVAPYSLASSFASLNIDTDTKQINVQLVNNNSNSASVQDADYEAWLNEKIGSIDTDLNEFDSYFCPSSFIGLTHQLQLLATGAQISLAAPLSYDAFIPKGTLTNHDIFTLYNRDSQLYTMRFTIEEIKGILEYSYSLWTNVMISPDDHALLLDYLLDGGTRLCLKNFTVYFLSAYGLDYAVDLTKPYGRKVKIISSPCTINGFLSVSINSFHANGGGNVLTRGTNLTYNQLRQRIIKVEPYDLRQCLIEQIKKVGEIHLQPISNWSFIPQEWAQPALARDREILIS